VQACQSGIGADWVFLIRDFLVWSPCVSERMWSGMIWASGHCFQRILSMPNGIMEWCLDHLKMHHDVSAFTLIAMDLSRGGGVYAFRFGCPFLLAQKRTKKRHPSSKRCRLHHGRAHAPASLIAGPRQHLHPPMVPGETSPARSIAEGATAQAATAWAHRC